MKRLFDVILALILLVLALPVMFLIALLIGVTSGRPILYFQDRPGLHGKVFRLVKFRTMTEAYDATGVPISDNERITTAGRWLRRTSLDELPELWNILKGEMSLVGPRPLLVEYLPLYSAHEAKRHDVKPGLTGLAQVNGRNAAPWEQRLELDTWYAENHSFWLDIKILWLTIWKVMSGDGVTHQGHETIERFRGRNL